MTHQKLNYLDILHKYGYRVTRQRLVILDAICAGDGHTTFNEIYARIREVDRTLDRSTLYRTLELFIAIGIIVSAERDYGEKVYEIIKHDPHHHLICRRCGFEQDISHEIMKGLFETLELTHQFSVDMDHLVVYGLCPKCIEEE